MFNFHTFQFVSLSTNAIYFMKQTRHFSVTGKDEELVPTCWRA